MVDIRWLASFAGSVKTCAAMPCLSISMLPDGPPVWSANGGVATDASLALLCTICNIIGDTYKIAPKIMSS